MGILKLEYALWEQKLLKEKDKQASSGAHGLSVQVNHTACTIMELTETENGLEITMPEYTAKLLEVEVP